MKRFTFNLDSLRRYKTLQMQQVENQLACVRQAISDQNERITGLEYGLSQMTLTAEAANVSSLERRLAESDYTKRINALIAASRRKAEELQVRFDQLRDEYLTASQEVESLNTLHDQQLAEHRREKSKQRHQELNDHITHSSRNEHMEFES